MGIYIYLLALENKNVPGELPVVFWLLLYSHNRKFGDQHPPHQEHQSGSWPDPVVAEARSDCSAQKISPAAAYRSSVFSSKQHLPAVYSLGHIPLLGPLSQSECRLGCIHASEHKTRVLSPARNSPSKLIFSPSEHLAYRDIPARVIAERESLYVLLLAPHLSKNHGAFFFFLSLTHSC